MKISLNWLKELVAVPAGVGPHDIAERLSGSGLEVESIEARGGTISGVRVAAVLGTRPHPVAEKLRIVRLTVGDGVEEDVVCGAPNVPGPGGRVAWAPPGARLPGGVTLGRKEIRGFESPGMICSERELGIGEDDDGILIVPPEIVVGADLVAALHLADHVLDVNVTPNRADALSHAGIAREVAALFATTWKLPQPPPPAESPGIETPFPVQVMDHDACPRYQATVIRGLAVRPGPLWMRLRLAACGVRAISNLVDVTNYVMLELGHPLHAFDLAKLSPPIVVRRATPGESLRTLDGVERALEPGDIVIADKHGLVGLAGVMGGGNSEVSEGTTNVLLEAATFDARSVRRTSRRLGLHSEAAHRFERGVDASTVALAGARAAALLAEVGGGSVAPTSTDMFFRVPPPRRVVLSVRKLLRIAGFEIPVTQVISTLGSLGIVSSVCDEGIEATVPSFRPDVTIEEDLVEEVMRMVGLDKVPARLPAGGKAPAPHPESTAERARDALAAMGLHEIVSWAFVSRRALVSLGSQPLASGVVVKNPISSEHEVMRTSLLPGLADAAVRNLARGSLDLKLFETGPVILPLPGDPARHHQQRTMAAGLMIGRRGGWLKPGEALDFFDLKSVVTGLFHRLRLPAAELNFIAASRDGASTATGDLGFFHPGISAGVHLSGQPVASLGQLHPRVARGLGLEVPVFYFEVELDALVGHAGGVRASPLARFPATSRDISFWIEATIAAADQERSMRELGEPLLRDIAVREDFRDPRLVAPGKKGMLWSLTYRSDDRTLTDAEVDSAHARIVAGLGRAHAIQIR